MSRTLIRNACVITLDDGVGDFARADILVEGERLVEIAPDLRVDDAEVVDAEHCIVVPGFVDAHRHTWQATIRSLNSDMFFFEYVTTLNPRYGAVHRPQDKYAGTLVGALEALDAGVTTLIEFGISIEGPEDSDAIVAALRDARLRAMYCHGVPSDWQRWWVDSALPHPADDARRVRREHFTGDDGLLMFGMALRGPERVRPEINRADFALARDLGARITAHIDAPGAIESMRDYLGPDTCYVHCCRSSELDLDLIKDSGGHVNVTPECEMGMHNAPVTHRLLKRGMQPSLGVDGPGTVSADMFVQMRLAYQEVRMRMLEEGYARDGRPPFKCPISTRDALRWATIEGARQFGLEHRIGTLTPGKQADLVMVRADGLHMSPVNHPVAAVVTLAGPRDVDSVMVAGRWRKRNGSLVDTDVARARRLIYESRDYIFAQAGVHEFCKIMPPMKF